MQIDSEYEHLETALEDVVEVLEPQEMFYYKDEPCCTTPADSVGGFEVAVTSDKP